MSTPNPQADLEAAQPDAEPVYETDIWNPLAADGHLAGPALPHARARAAPRLTARIRAGTGARTMTIRQGLGTADRIPPRARKSSARDLHDAAPGRAPSSLQRSSDGPCVGRPSGPARARLARPGLMPSRSGRRYGRAESRRPSRDRARTRHRRCDAEDRRRRQRTCPSADAGRRARPRYDGPELRPGAGVPDS